MPPDDAAAAAVTSTPEATVAAPASVQATDPGAAAPSDAAGGDASAAPAAETPAAAPDPAAVDAAQPISHTDTAGTLAVAEPAPEPEKPVAEPAVQKPEEKPAAEPAKAEPLSYAETPLALPDGVAFEPERVAALDAIVGPHRLAPEARQALADLHIAEMQRYAEHLSAEQHRVFAETRAGWRRESMADPEFGGPSFETHVAAAVRMLEFFTPPDERRALNEALMATGFTDHPAFFRLMNRVAQKFNEPAHGPTGIKPPPDAGKRNSGSGRLRDLYDHPSSTQGR